MRIIAGEKKGGKLFEVLSNETRSTTDRVKESIFNIIGPYFNAKVCADFFAGSGSLCIEALSRGCETAYFFDSGLEQINIIESNIKKFKYESKSIVRQCDFKNSFKYIDKKLDLVFLDPPYGHGYCNEVLQMLINKKSLNNNALIVCEIENIENILYEGYNLIGEYKYGRIKIIVLEWLE